MATKNEHLIPKIIVDLVENRNAAWKSDQQRLVEEARLIAIYEYIGEVVVKSTKSDISKLSSSI